MTLSLCFADILISCLLLVCLKPRAQPTAQDLLPDWRPLQYVLDVIKAQNRTQTCMHRHTPDCTREITCCTSTSNSHSSSLLSLPLECFSSTIIKIVSQQTNFFLLCGISALKLSDLNHFVVLSQALLQTCL